MMKSLRAIAFLAIMILHGVTSFAQTKTWIGGASGTWFVPSNWSPAGAPISSDTVIINSDAVITLNVVLNLGSLRVDNNATVTLRAGTNNGVLSGNTIESPGLLVTKGATLILQNTGIAAGDYAFHVAIAANGVAVIDGSLICKGDDAGGDARLQADAGNTGKIYINGVYRNDPSSGNLTGNGTSLIFGTGSFLIMNDDGGTIPSATYDATSTIMITGAKNLSPTFTSNASGDNVYGNIEYDCPAQAANLNMQLPSGLTGNTLIKGNLVIKKTNSFPVLLNTSVQSMYITKNLRIAGPSATVIISNGNSSTTSVNVAKSLVIASGCTLNMQENATGNDTLRIAKNVNIAGTLLTNSTNAGVFEMNGATISNVNITGAITGNITFKINNAQGVRLVAPLILPAKLQLENGAIVGNNNPVTLNSSATDAVIGGTVTSYVNGILKRATATSGAEYLFPIGKPGIYRPIAVIPATATAGIYSAEYIKSNPLKEVGSSAIAPLTALCKTEYWNIESANADGASIKLILNGTVVAAPASPESFDTLVAAHYTNGKWQQEYNAAGVLNPGNSSTGSVTSGTLTSFGPVTFGVLGSTLPIHLISFKAFISGVKTAKLEWITDGIDNGGKFEVMKSTNGRDYKTIAALTSVLGKTQYTATDAQLFGGNNYYLLKVTDREGKLSYSEVVRIIYNDGGVNVVRLAPTATSSTSVLTIVADKNEKANILVYNMQGKIIRNITTSLTTGENNITIDASAFAAGMYKVVLQSNSFRSVTMPLLKN